MTHKIWMECVWHVTLLHSEGNYNWVVGLTPSPPGNPARADVARLSPVTEGKPPCSVSALGIQWFDNVVTNTLGTVMMTVSSSRRVTWA